MSRLMIYDTVNFMDFPIGGELTSIRNFLRYLCESHPERTKDVALVGITTEADKVGKAQTVSLFGHSFAYLPVALAETDLSKVSRSLRLAYAKGLLRFLGRMKPRREDCHYIHTPEAYGVVKLRCPGASCVIFSHGSYFNMEKGFRFFQRNALVKKGFAVYLNWILRNAALIFVLDKESLRDYAAYNANLVKVRNSVICAEANPRRTEGRVLGGEGLSLLFVGRLSKDKRVGPIIEAAGQMEECTLTVVGDGEEYGRLLARKGENVRFVGAVKPDEVKEYMRGADILVMNSVFEGMPMTILEALSLGLPVISTNVGAIGEVLRFGQDAEESDGTPESIAAAARRIADNYESYSRNAFETAAGYDYRAVNEPVYQRLCRYWSRDE